MYTDSDIEREHDIERQIEEENNVMDRKLDFEEEVIYHLELLGEMTTSDAQALLDANQETLSLAWGNNMTGKQTARSILTQSI